MVNFLFASSELDRGLGDVRHAHSLDIFFVRHLCRYEPVCSSGYPLGYHDAIWHPRARIQDIIKIYPNLDI
jgi:hypothetical protein